jgi:Rrf2 family protein
MFRLYSKGCEYALRALLQFAPAAGNERFQAESICRKADIPESFTRKVFQSLVQGGFLTAFRGPGGGYTLTEDPSRITLLRIIQAVDGVDTFDSCVLGLPQCGSEKACPLHEVWYSAKQRLIAQLRETTLQDLLDVSDAAKPARKSKARK